MPAYTIESAYRLPAYRQRTYHAETPERACRLAIEDDSWDSERLDYESAGETHVVAIWLGADAAYSGEPLPVPPHFREADRSRRRPTWRRKLGHPLAARAHPGTPRSAFPAGERARILAAAWMVPPPEAGHRPAL